MSKSLLTIGLLVATSLIIAGCVQPTPTPGFSGPTTSPAATAAATATPTETLAPSAAPSGASCGTDINCFIEASRTCAMADVEFSYSFFIFGLNSTTTQYQQLKGLEAGKCTYFQRVDNVTVKFTEALIQQILARNSSVTREQLAQAEANATKSAQISVGSNKTCSFETGELTAVLTRWKAGKFDFGSTHCTGGLGGVTNCTTIGGDFGNASCINSPLPTASISP